MTKEKVNKLGMSAEYRGYVSVYVNNDEYRFKTDDDVENVIARLSRYYDLTSEDIHDIKFMW